MTANFLLSLINQNIGLNEAIIMKKVYYFYPCK